MAEIILTVTPRDHDRNKVRYERVVRFQTEENGRLLRIVQQFDAGKATTLWFCDQILNFRIEEYADGEGQQEPISTDHGQPGDETGTSVSS